MNLKTQFVFLFTILLVLTACEKDENPTDTSLVKSGVFCANQGKFPDGNGSVSWLTNDQLKSSDLYEDRNPGLKLGNTVQSIYFNANQYFIAVNNAKNITITDESFKLIKTLEVQSLPRYFVGWGNKTIVSSWGINGAQGEINVISENNNVERTVKFNGAPEKMLVHNNRLWVTLSNGFSVDSILVQFSLPDFTMLTYQTLAKGPNSMVMDASNNLYVLCEGHFDWLTGQSYEGALFKWQENGSSVKLFNLPQGCVNLCLDKSQNTLYFNDYAAVYKFKIGDNNFEKLKLTTEPSSIYGLAIDEPNKILYYTDPKDFASQGSLISLNLDSGVSRSYPVGVAPGQIFIRN